MPKHRSAQWLDYICPAPYFQCMAVIILAAFSQCTACSTYQLELGIKESRAQSQCVSLARSLYCGGPQDDSHVIENIISASMFRMLIKPLAAQGGAVSLAAASVLRSDGCQFIENAATRGGALYSGAANMSLINSVLINNYARTTGGAVFTEAGGSLIVQGSNFTKNQAGAHEAVPHEVQIVC